MQRFPTMSLATGIASQDNQAILGYQVRLSPYQIRDNVPVVGLCGLVSRPLPGAQHVVLYPNGDPANAVIIGHNDQRHYLQGLPDGCIGLAHHLGASVLFYDDRIEVQGNGKPVTIKNASEVTIEAATVRIVGDLEVTGEVKAKADGAFVTLSQHKGHTGGGQPPTPNT